MAGARASSGRISPSTLQCAATACSAPLAAAAGTAAALDKRTPPVGNAMGLAAMCRPASDAQSTMGSVTAGAAAVTPGGGSAQPASTVMASATQPAGPADVQRSLI